MTALLNQSATRFSDSQAYYLEVNPTVINLGGATLSTINGDLTVNGQSYNPNTWSLYSTVSSTITFGLPTPGIQLEVQQGSPPAPPYLFFDNNQLAYVSQVGNVADWALFPAIADVSIPNPFSLNADNANISTCTISSLTVDSINGGGSNTLNISSINAQLTLTSSFALTNGNISPNINLGLGPLFGNIGAWATGAVGVTVGSAALVTGAVGLMLPRQTNYITQGDVEMVNVTTQLQVSTLNAQTSSITRTLDITNQEIFTSTINTVPVQAIRSLSDPFQNASTGTASYLQAVSQWYPLPNFATVPALTDINVNTNNLLSTTSMTIYNGASIGGDLRVNTGPSYGGSWLAGLPGALQPENPNTNGPSDIRLRQLMFNDGSGFANEVMLVNTTNSGRIGVNCGTPLVASALAYLSDGGGATAFTFYVAKNGVDTNPGTINAPFLTIGAAITARGLISNTIEVAILVSAGTYTQSFTLTQNTFLVGLSTGEQNQPCNIIGSVTMNCTTGQIALSGLQILPTALVTAAVTVSGAGGVYSIYNCNVTAVGNNALDLNTGTVYVTESRIIGSNGAHQTINIGSAATVIIRDCTISNQINNLQNLIGCNGNLTLRNSIIQSTNLVSTVLLAILSFGGSASKTIEITSCNITYANTLTDTVGNKCCILFNNSSGTFTVSMSNCVMACVGAITGNPQQQCIQKTGAGTVNLLYGNLLAQSPPHHIAPTIVKTSYTTVP
jgi:hypothetical protein